MGIFGGFLKVISILTVVLSAAGCTLVCVETDSPEAYVFLACLFACIALMALVAWGAGAALTEAHRLKKKNAHLEQQLAALTRTVAVLQARETRPTAAAPVREARAAAPAPEARPAPPAPVRTVDDPRLAEYLGNAPLRGTAASMQRSTLPEQRPVRSVQTPPAEPESRGVGKWIAIVAVALVLVVILGGLAGYFFRSSAQESPASHAPAGSTVLPPAPAAESAAPAGEAIPLAIGQAIDNDKFTMTFDTMEVADEYTFRLSENSTSSLFVEEGYKLLMVRGHFTNKSTSVISESAFVRDALVNGEYSVDGFDVRMTFQRNKYFEIDPYTDLDYVLYINIPQKLAEQFETATFTLRYKEDLSLPVTTWNVDGSVTTDADIAYAVTGGAGVAAPAAPAATEAPALEENPAPAAKTLSLGDTIVTDSYEFTLNNVELTYEVLPPNTSSVYSSYAAESGKVYVHVDAHVKNTMKRDIRIDELFKSSVLYAGEYPYTGFTIVNDGDNRFDWVGSYVAAAPLETCHAHALVECPAEVDQSGKSVTVTLNLDGTDYEYRLR